jgi:hypothetical protein
MATVDQVKEKYIVKAEKNGTNDSITTDNYRICLLFNESQNKFLTLHLQNRGIDDVRYIQNFLVLDKKIPYSSKSESKYDFKLPENYFDLADVRSNAQKDKCSDLINLFELRTENINEVLSDEYTKPSFEWREALYTVNSNNLSIHTDKSFKVSEILLNYYRYPKQLKLLNEQDPESGFDTNSLIEWDDKSLDDIISLMVFNSDINENNPAYQLQTLRIQK